MKAVQIFVWVMECFFFSAFRVECFAGIRVIALYNVARKFERSGFEAARNSEHKTLLGDYYDEKLLKNVRV